MIDQSLVRSAARSPRTSPPPVAMEDVSAALRALPHGGLDDSTRRLDVSPAARSSLAPVVVSLRWAAIAYALIFSTQRALDGEVGAVSGLAVAVFLTTWRSILPLRLGSEVTADRVVAVTDVVLLGGAAGYAGGPEGALTFCVLVAVGVAAFGWGAVIGVVAAGAGFLALAVGTAIDGNAGQAFSADAAAFAIGLGVVTLVGVVVRQQLLATERRRREDLGRIDALAETNDLLVLLNSVARTLPASLSTREAIANIRDELLRPFQPTVICLLDHDEVNDEWVPKLAEGCVLRPSMTTASLPPALADAIDRRRPVLRTDLARHRDQAVTAAAGSGLYVELRARDRLVGLLGMEHPLPDHFVERDRRLLGGLADLLALTLDNARRFSRLRSLGAEEERSRIARDLHDRLGQWLTFISFELERIIAAGTDSAPSLSRLYEDVQRALEELRETLRQLRSEVTADKPLSIVAAELIDRFTERTDIEVEVDVPHPDEHLPVGVENELLRILQESLSNTDKHAEASRVWVTWDVHDGVGVLEVRDDGRGFDPDHSIRENAYGLVGMRERADAIGARLTITSSPGTGTTIRVAAGVTAPPSKEMT